MAIQQSYWHASSAELNFSAIADGIETEVVVVGGGITGLSAAYFLKQSGKKVVVIEKGKIGSGTSGSTTGKVTSQHNLIYAKLKTHHGIETARTYGQANQTAIEQIDKIIVKEKIECSWQRDDNFVYSTNPEMINSLKEEVETAKECGLPATFETSSPLPLEIAGAVRFANQAKFHSRNYLLGLAKAIAGEGSLVFEQSRATGFSDGQPCEVTANGVKIRANQVIIATNVPTLPLIARGSYCLLEYPLQTYHIAFKARPALTGMYISPDKNHYSILPISNGSEQLLFNWRRRPYSRDTI